jgi:tripartite-type tricarboxylate transporter receptor subunit TctC
MPALRDGKLKPIATGGKTRSVALPEVPTMAEAGLPGFDISTWYGLLAPAGTPADVVRKWNADVTRILNTPEMRERLIAQGAEAAPDTPAEFTRFIADELARYARIVKTSGAKVD